MLYYVILYYIAPLFIECYKDRIFPSTFATRDTTNICYSWYQLFYWISTADAGSHYFTEVHSCCTFSW